MIRLGLIGYPVEHSLSPVLYETALRASGLDGQYALFPVRPGDMAALCKLIDGLRTGELSGLNVTIPHKQTAIQFVDELTPTAAAIGAVNTLYSRGGKVLGDNTDAPGFLADVERLTSSPKSALVLGAGGAARAVIYALRKEGCSISIAARKKEQAELLAQQFSGVQAMELSAEALADATVDLIVNATPAGMYPSVHECPWPAGLALPKKAAVYDLVYSPSETHLFRLARAAGLRAITGLGMLIEQAALAFELWTQYRIPRDLLLDAVRRQAL